MKRFALILDNGKHEIVEYDPIDGKVPWGHPGVSLLDDCATFEEADTKRQANQERNKELWL
jgi:hypothetical protein